MRSLRDGFPPTWNIEEITGGYASMASSGALLVQICVKADADQCSLLHAEARAAQGLVGGSSKHDTAELIQVATISGETVV